MVSVNQRLPSGPLAIPNGTMLQPNLGSHSGANPVNWPSVVTLPMKKSGKPEGAVNHSALSGPETMSDGCENRVGTTNSVMFPRASIRPIWLTSSSDSVNHILPSDPRVICLG